MKKINLFKNKKVMLSLLVSLFLVIGGKVWAATITHNNKVYYLGSYHTEEDAAKAYDKKALELYGDNARRNFPELTAEDLAKISYTPFENLSKNQQGMIRNVPKTSIYVGVHRINEKKSGRIWCAAITQNDKTFYIGCYDSEEEAAIAYDEKALELYGEDANLNFPHLTTKERKALKDKIAKKYPTRQKSSPYIGIYFKTNGLSYKKWGAAITHRNKKYRLGLFNSQEEAAHAYDLKALELYGWEAKLNFPLD